MRNRKWVHVALMFMLTAWTVSPILVCAESQGEVEEMLLDAFRAVSTAGEAGGNVTSLVVDLNDAIELLAEAENTGNASLAEAAVLHIQSVMEVAPSVAQTGVAAGQMRLLTLGVSLSGLAFAAFVAYKYIPLVFWRLWIRSKKDWKVET